MNTYRLSCVLLLMLAPFAQAQEGEQPSPPLLAAGSGSSRDVRLMADRDGNLVLAVHLPWKVYSRPSVEVCLLPEDVTDGSRIHPVRFVPRFLKGEVTVNLYHALDRADDVPVRMPFEKEGISFEILGNRNSLGKTAVCVACRTKTPDKKVLPRATFCLLEYWSGEDETLYLDLSAGYFSDPGRLRIWLLRDASVVWSETIAWPGMAAHRGSAPGVEATPQAKQPPKAE